MTLKINATPNFKRDLKKLKKKHYDMDKFKIVLNLLVNKDFDKLVKNYSDHKLTGNLNGLRALHIEPNWVLVYRLVNGDVELIAIDLIATGNHEIYNKI